MMQVAGIAVLCHELNRAYCDLLGDTSQPAWDQAPDWQKDSAIAGVEHALAGDRSPRQTHESWLAQKEADGWKYGPVKDAEKKEHPCFVPYDELPDAQKLKDTLFLAVVDAVSGNGAQRVRDLTNDLAAAQVAAQDLLKEVQALQAKNEEQAHRIADLEMVNEDESEAGDDRPAGDELEKFIKQHGDVPLRFVVGDGRVRVSRLDQTAALEGRVRGNRFIPKN